MQTSRFFLGLLVCASMCACSDDKEEIFSEEEETPKVFSGDEAYISVRLADAGTLSRSSRATTTDPGYEYGTADEHAVSNAYFYFYDGNGAYVAQGTAWNGGNATTEKPNIEFKSNNVVVLKGLTGKNYPKYMVTVLNGTSTFDYGQTLDAMEKKLSGGIYTNISDTDYFIMSTTSWAGQKNAENEAMKYFVTEVKESNFSREPIEDSNSGEYVTVYVERLAAKVTLKVNDDALKPTTINGKTYYEIKATVAGEGNDDDVTGNGNQIAAENLYVELLGWKLNATAKNSNIVKNIDENWSDSQFGFTWNKPSDARSLWGMSYNYGQTGYPENAAGAAGSQYLEYVNLNSGVLDLGADAYCAENTNTSAIVTANFPSAVTSILLKARICDKTGTPLDLVRFNGLLFEQPTFLKYIVNVMNTKGMWNVWVETTTTGATDRTFEQADDKHLELVNVGDGEVKVQLKSTNPDLYERVAATGSGYTFNKIETTDLGTVNTNLATESAETIGYTGGLMYYNIPIEHLNPAAVSNDGVVPEAKYGVVRNHQYVVTINKLENLGKGIFDGDEVIVPGKDDDKETYYVGANINVLSWKIVSQDVNL